MLSFLISNFRIPISLQTESVKLILFDLAVHSLKYKRSTTLGCKNIEIQN